MATLLGLAISRLGGKYQKMDETVIKAFNLHLEFNYQKNSGISISRSTQSAALLSLALYLREFSLYSYSDLFLRQIEARPINENNQDRCCYSLSAGLALGLMNLGKGSTGANSAEKILNQLLTYT